MGTVQAEPMMVIGAALNAAIMLAGAFIPVLFGTHLTQDEMGAVSTISTALTSGIAAAMTTPIQVGAVNSAVATALVAGASFGLKMSPAEIATIAGSLTTILSYIMREKVSALVT